jgi:nucleoside-diphosphate-sugar epimerase
MKVIVLGSNGFIGSNIVRAHPEWIGLTRQDIDLTNQENVDVYFSSHRDIDVVIHCAVIGGSRLKVDGSDVFYKNLLMFENVARHAKKMIYFSSGAAIQGNPPTNPYGFSKWIIDRRIETIPNYYSLRIWGCYGEGELPTRFSAICKEKGHVVISQDRYFDFIDVKDVVKVVAQYVKGELEQKSYDLVYPGEKLLLSQWAEKFGATYTYIKE